MKKSTFESQQDDMGGKDLRLICGEVQEVEIPWFHARFEHDLDACWKIGCQRQFFFFSPPCFPSFFSTSNIPLPRKIFDYLGGEENKILVVIRQAEKQRAREIRHPWEFFSLFRPPLSFRCPALPTIRIGRKFCQMPQMRPERGRNPRMSCSSPRLYYSVFFFSGRSSL